VLVNIYGDVSCTYHASPIPIRNYPSSEPNYFLVIEQANIALQANPKDPEAHFQLGVAYSNLDSVYLGFKHFCKSMNYDPHPKRIELANNNIRHNYNKHYMMGQKAFEHKHYEIAAKEFKKATLADPRQWLGFFKLGVTYTQLGTGNKNNCDLAKRAFEKAFYIAPDDDKKIVIDAFDELLAKSNP
jgi:tetratricopeptide (TPR) repeat protein